MSPRSDHRFALLAALAFSGLFAWLRDKPILLQHQGSHLVRAAHSLTEGAGLMVTASEPLAFYGPLYAVLLAPLELAGLSVGAAAYLLNCAVWATCIPLLASLGRELGLKSNAPLLLLWTLWAPGIYMMRAVRADLLPIALSLVAALALLRRARNGSGGIWAIGVACGLAGLARYMAFLTLFPVMVAGLWLTPSGDRRRDRKATLAVLVIGAGPVLVWFARNLAWTGYATGMSRSEPREVMGESHSLLENLELVARTLLIDAFSWAGLGVRVWNGERPGQGYTLLSAAIFGGLLLFATAALRRHPGARGAPNERRAVRLCLGFSGFYLAVLLLLWTFGNNDPINTRYVAPMYPFLLALVCRLLSLASDLPARWPAVAVIFALVLAALPNAAKTIRLLGPEPGEQLIEDRVWENRPPTWRHAIDWDNVRRLRDPRDRIYAASE